MQYDDNLLFVILLGDSWTLNADGLTPSMTLKSFVVLKLIKNLKVKEIPSTELTARPGYDAISNYIIGDPVILLVIYIIYFLFKYQKQSC